MELPCALIPFNRRRADMPYFLTIGAIMGLSAGFAPGPLLTLVISETLQHGLKSGVKVAIAPVVTDLPIILLSLFILKKISGSNELLGAVSLFGAVFVFFLGCRNFFPAERSVTSEPARPKSFLKGVAVNAFSPHPYLFWIGVGTPILFRAFEQSTLTATLFLCCFYLLLVGSKLLLALLISQSRSFLSGTAYSIIVRVLGTLLVIFSLFLLRDALTCFGIIQGGMNI